MKLFRKLFTRYVLYGAILFMADYTNSVASITSGFGASSQRQTSLDNNFAAGTNTMTLTAAPGMRRGYCRVRTKGSVANPPTQSATGVITTSLVISASDGTRTYTIHSNPSALGAANVNIDIIVPFNLDIVATTFVATLVTTTAAVFADFELVGGN